MDLDTKRRLATPEEVAKADAEVLFLLKNIEHLDLIPAADFIRGMQPPLSAEAIAWLGFRAIDLHEKARQAYASARQRDRDPLTRVLREILDAKPSADVGEVIEALRSRAGPGLELEDVHDDGAVTWYKGQELQEATRDSIMKRISRLRPKKTTPR